MNINYIKRIINRVCFLGVFMMFLSGSTLCAKAEVTISNLTVSSSTPSYEAGEVRVPEFIAPSGCDLETRWVSSDSAFSPGKTVTAELTLTAEDGYSFSSNPTLRVSGATISSKSVSSDEIIIKVKVGPLYYKLEAPEKVAWASERSAIVKWSAVKHATEYQIKIYNDDVVVRTETVKGRSFDAGKYFNGENGVSVAVIARSTGSSNSSYIVDSDEVFVDGSDVDWDDKETTYGVWKGDRYRLSDDDEDSVYATGWVEIFGKWYYFGQNELLQKGWFQDGDKKYYSDSEGVMQVGWVKPKGSEEWYYFRSNGEMVTGWLAAGAPGTWYYMGTDGSMKKGWIQDNQKWYFMEIEGKMLKGWQSINGNWYYFYEDGHMASSETIDSYYVNGDGVWVH